MIKYMYNCTFFLVFLLQRRLTVDKLENHQKYYYESKDTFVSEIDEVHAFPRSDFETGMHMQDFFEINIITRGKGKHYIEDNSVNTQKGDVFIVPPMVRHGFKGGSGFDVFHVLISDRFIKRNISDLQLIPLFFTLFTAEPLIRGKVKNALHLRLSAARYEELNELLNVSLRHRNKFNSFDCLARKGFAVMLIAFLCKVYSENSDNKVDGDTKNDEAFLKSISYIHEHYFEKISVDTLAKVANLSRSTFLRKFTDVCKMPPSEYVMNRRIEASEYMLLHTSESLMNIAFKCGFYDAAHFSRIFVKKKGMSPSAYRKKALSESEK